MEQDKLTEQTAENCTALEHEPAAINVRPRRVTTLSAKATENYEASCEQHRRRTDAAWECVEAAILKLSNAHEEAVDVIAAQLRSSYERYKKITDKYTAFLTATETQASRKELDMLSAIDADRDMIVKERLRETTEQARNLRAETASKRSLSVSSRASSVSRRSRSSTMSIAAAQARAQADAIRARAAFSRREAAMRLEKAKIDAELEILHHEREVAVAEAQANALEAAAEQDGGERSRVTPSIDPTLRTASYVTQQEELNGRFQSPHSPVVSRTNRDENDSVLSGAAVAQNSPTGVRVIQPPPIHEVAPDGSSTELAGVLKFLCRRDLVSGGLTKFDDQPENYRAWKSSFKGVTRDLGLSPREELDLLIKWLGPRSATQAQRLKSVHVEDFAAGLNTVWNRLDGTYGCPEVVEDSLLKRLEDFPRVSHRDAFKLQELSDLLLELEVAKADPHLAGLRYLDTARGVNAIVAKLPPGLQEKWMSAGSKYKKEHQTAFPPFSFFSKFIMDEAGMRNDPSFKLSRDTPADFSARKQDNSKTRPKATVSTKKTEIDSTSADACQDTIPNGQPAQAKNSVDKWCPLHKKPHPLEKCRAFREKNQEERTEFLRQQGICMRCCLSHSHIKAQCQAILRCRVCDSGDHATALHVASPSSPLSSVTASNVSAAESSERRVTSTRTHVASGSDDSKSCAKLCLVDVAHDSDPSKTLRAYVILDEQSNRSLIKSELLDYFRVNGTPVQYTLRTCSGNTAVAGRSADGFSIHSLAGDVKLHLPPLLECNEIPDNRSEIPTPDAAQSYPHLRKIANEIPPIDSEANILLLLGRDILRAHKVRRTLNGPHDAPYAQKLDLGWVIVGDVCANRTRKATSVNVFKTHVLENGRPSLFEPCSNHFFVKETPVPKANELPPPQGSTVTADTKGIHSHRLFETTNSDEQRALSIEDRKFIEMMDRDFARNETNSWVAPLPFRTPRCKLPNNRQQALSRLFSLRRTLLRNPETRERFMRFMEELFVSGHAEEAPPLCENDERWYLPIFGVCHPQKPDQIRVVFDSSAQHEGVSLNSALLTGPDMTNNLVGILVRFREEPVGVMADVQQMFYSFTVREDHRDFLRFLWFRDNDLNREIIECRMKVHVFGNSPSPAVATYGLRRTAREAVQQFGEDAKKFVERDFYVDDALKSFPTEEDAIGLLKTTQQMLASANIRLHKIASNRQNVLLAFPSEDHAKGLQNLDFSADPLPTQRSLGLLWDVRDDSFVFRAPLQDKPYTRRGVLSTVNSLYDPLGFVAPVTVQGKHLLRELTAEGYDWDTPLSEDKRQQWDDWKTSLHALHDLRIARSYAPMSLREARCKELHVFSDASTKAVAAVAYLRVIDVDGGKHIGFVMGKAKLTPQPEHTIPRLELCAAVLAVEMTDFILREIDFRPDSVVFYTDSKVVLGYIFNETRRFHVYVANRVQRIRKSTRPEQWKYVRTDENPADHATRMVPATRLKGTNWFTAPDFLSRHETDPATQDFVLVDPDHDKELRPEASTFVTKVNVNERLGSNRFSRFSSWQSLQRAVASLIRVVRQRGKEPQPEADAVLLLLRAKTVAIGAVQQDAFSEEIHCIREQKSLPRNSPLRKLDPFLDARGLLRVGGRLNKGDFPDDERNPLIIPGRHHVATLLVRHYHERVQHQGRHFTEGAIRSAGFWLIGGKRCICSVLSGCVLCKKLRGRFQEQKMADLPKDRLSEDPPFTNVGIDVFGSWTIAARRTRGGIANSKRWAVIFTCLSIRAVHIEVIESLDTTAFINALRRFLAIRGPVKLIRSDCGTNFVGACRELGINAKSLDSSDVGNFLSENGCTWAFNPPHASHMGGAWERMIGITRRILDSMLIQNRHHHLTHDTLATFMAEVSAIINARPLAPVSYDPEDPYLLTPATLLTQKTGEQRASSWKTGHRQPIQAALATSAGPH
ncbi:uncharacterized protein LOC119378234 [Rhipicephalus sanguineus]|uniref:uncharacterized protein LOC119378234 n=1 Tax=Rhipicephalus sanguineus TaxID=34632 RepID=UPI0018943766|nr:uncharacterized protein LOC119378234 [Rhipicephalus sanguineus]